MNDSIPFRVRFLGNVTAGSFLTLIQDSDVMWTHTQTHTRTAKNDKTFTPEISHELRDLSHWWQRNKILNTLIFKYQILFIDCFMKTDASDSRNAA